MKHSFLSFIIFQVLGILTPLLSQNLSVGLYSGVYVSDIHGTITSGKWSCHPGPKEKMRIGWDFNNLLGIQSGIDYYSFNYEYHTGTMIVKDLNTSKVYYRENSN